VRADEAPQPDALRIFAAEAALDLHDADLAERCLNALSSPSFAAEMQLTLRGRAAFERGDGDRMLQSFRAAAAITPSIKPKLYAELGQRLLRLGRTAEAVAIFDEVGPQELPPQVHSEYVRALMEANDLPRAAGIVKELGDPTSAPDWAVGILSDIAARQGDLRRSVELLTILAERHPSDPRMAYEMARRLLAINDADNAVNYLGRATANISQLEPQEQMAVAHLLKEASRLDEAAALAFSAFRAAPQDPALHRGLATLFLTHETVHTNFTGAVADQTYVRLTSDEETQREYVIYADGPIDPLRNELSLQDAAKAGLVGKREGDTLAVNRESWPKTRWTVVEVLPAIVYVFRDVVAHFEDRFPSEPFFIHMMKMPDENSVKFLAPVISSLHSRKERSLAVLKLYGENVLPLGFFAVTLGVRIPDVMHTVRIDADIGPLRAEWFDLEGQEESRRVARAAKRVVLTRSAFETLSEINILNVVATAYDWCIPSSFLDAMKQEIAEADEKTRDGHGTMVASESGIQVEEIAAGDPRLHARANRARILADWLTANARVEYRPLETIQSPGSGDEEMRTSIGGDSIDSVRLAEHFGIAMLADDVGLRRLLPKGSSGTSFSTITLLTALAETGRLSTAEAELLLLELVRRNYAAVQPTHGLLLAAIRQERSSTQDLRRVFALLGGPVLDLSASSRVAAETLKASLLLPLRFIGTASLTNIILEGLSTRWPTPLAAQAFTNAAALELALLPNELKIVRDTITAYRRRRRDLQ
jgi:tetratricopeptide (TPR) repeat protein